MNLEWNDKRMGKFVTNAGLITSNGPYGYDIMAAEWTHYISYAPALIMVNIDKNAATHENIQKSNVFGVNIAAWDQNMVASIAGGSSGKKVDKISVLKELGVEFYNGKIDVLMVRGAAMNAECKLIEAKKVGDHMMFIGEVLEVTAHDKESLVYHNGKFWKIGEQLHKPDEKMMSKIQTLVEKYTKK